MLTPLRLPFIERRPKRLFQSLSWRDAIGLAKRPDLATELLAIRRYIVSDLELPERYYRHGRFSTPDRLLDEDGIMHLHLGSPDTPELLFLVQFERDVVLLEISSHYHFEYDPPGTVLRQLHESKLRDWQERRE